MSLADMAEESLSPSSTPSSASSSRVSLTVPTSLLILPPTAALIGLSIGIVRGGNRARLRFLAENAHRQPTTVQGWYFYTKTRNYRVFFASAKTGTRYALALGGATALYVLADESVGWTREQLFGPSGEIGKGRIIPRSRIGDAKGENEEGETHKPFMRVGWREGPVKWEDGAVAGSLLGAGVGIAFLGAVLGGTTSVMQIAQAHVGKLREEEEERAAAAGAGASAATATTSSAGPEESAAAASALITEETAPTSSLQRAAGTSASTSTLPPADPLSGQSDQSWWTRVRDAFGL